MGLQTRLIYTGEIMGNSIKKRIKLKEEHIKYLLELPESGMGYQIVDITLKNGQQLKKRIVLNSQFLLLENSENIDSNFIEKVEGGKK